MSRRERHGRSHNDFTHFRMENRFALFLEMLQREKTS